jgi:hypothetical protein
MKKITILLALLFALIILIDAQIQRGSSELNNTPCKRLKIGTYDSRAVTYAYFSSDQNTALRQQLKKERDEIMKTSDTTKWKETMCKVLTEDYLLHQRVFATGSAAFILEKVKKQIPAIAKTAGVDVLVSKWELTWCDSSAIIVDLTDSVAQLFTPIDKLGKTYEEIKKMVKLENDEFTVDEMIEMWVEFEKKYMGK